jgi:hypothetical protein
MKSNGRLTARWTRRAMAVATILALSGVASIGAAGDKGERGDRGRRSYKGTWILQSAELLIFAPNPDRCGNAFEVVLVVRGVDDLGGLYSAELSYCTADGSTNWDLKQTTTYDNEGTHGTTDMVCSPQTSVLDVAQCRSSYSDVHCVFTGGTGDMEGIKGSVVVTGLETGDPCDGSTSHNGNDAGAFWYEGSVFFPHRR